MTNILWFLFKKIFEQYQTGKYVMHAEDLPCTSKLPYVQQPTKCPKFREDTGKIYNCICGGAARVVVPSAQIWCEKYIPCAENKLSSLGALIHFSLWKSGWLSFILDQYVMICMLPTLSINYQWLYYKV